MEFTSEMLLDKMFFNNGLAKAKLDDFIEEKFPRINRDNLFEKLVKNGAVIAGSAIAQSILGVNWLDSDLDIWVPTNKFSLSTLSYTTATEEDLAPEVKDVLSVFEESHKITRISHSYEGGGYLRLRSFVDMIVYLEPLHDEPSHAKPSSVQILGLLRDGRRFRRWPGYYWKPVVASFDIEALQIVFDGWYFQQIVADPRRPCPIDHLRDRRMTISPVAASMQDNVHDWMRTCRRLLKYKKRGFHMEWSETIFNMLVEMFLRPLACRPKEVIGNIVEEWNDIQKSLGDGDPNYMPIEITFRPDQGETGYIETSFGSRSVEFPFCSTRAWPAKKCFESVRFDELDLPLSEEKRQQTLVLLSENGRKVSCMDREWLRRQIEENIHDRVLYYCEDYGQVFYAFIRLSTDFGDMITYLRDVQDAYFDTNVQAWQFQRTKRLYSQEGFDIREGQNNQVFFSEDLMCRPLHDNDKERITYRLEPRSFLSDDKERSLTSNYIGETRLQIVESGS